ncbi:hypothetical protein QLX67_11470, partial [Balneolaceae bacterium ANBcel3]|nr:hypothetical protein [Balneolaceae bacterium ANBcel3]
AARLQKEHWDVHVIASDSCWICLANALVKPNNRTIDDLCDYLSYLSDNYGGTFQKWELGSTF